MKLTLLIALAAILEVNAGTYAHSITLKTKSVNLESVFKAIHKQNGYDFFFNRNLLKKAVPVTLDLRNASIEDALKACLTDQPFNYVLENKTVILKEKQVVTYQVKLSTIITGVVKDTIGVTIPGVTVLNTKTGKSVPTDAKGVFKIEADPGDVLTFSFVGFNKQSVTVSTETQLTVIMHEASNQLNAVVVTALGIKKTTRSLTYNVQELRGEELTRNKDANFVNSLAGKVAGVTINPSSSGIGGATRVVMRGTKSIAGNNNALYVIDGIPIINANGGAASGPFNGVVSGEGISSLNPEDIESSTVLTGPSATALYGNMGANGVIMVTTKKGAVGKVRVNFSHSSDFFSPFVMPRFQNTYGQSSEGNFYSWGSKLSTPSTYKPKDFFQTGNNIFNSISISGGTEKSQTFFSVGTDNANGIIPKNTYNRYNFTLRHTANITDRLTLDFGAMYAKMSDNNMISQGQYTNPLLGAYLFPPGDDIRKYQIYERYDPDRKIPVQFWPFGNQGLTIENPYWATQAESNSNKIDRYMLNTTAKYKVTDWMDISARARLDNTNTTSEIKRPAGTDGILASEFGFYGLAKGTAKSTYVDVLASIKKSITPEIGFNANIGGSYQDAQNDVLAAGGNLVRVANFYSVQENTANIPTQPNYFHTQVQSAYATAEFDYKKWLYLTATGRNEWSSQLAMSPTKHYFYPSVGIAGILTDAFNIPRNILSFAKVRFSYAEVGNAPTLTNPAYSLINPDAVRPAPFPEFQPERTKSYEAGAELRFFDNKLNLSATVYKSNTTNQLLQQPVTGSIYNIFYYNAGNIQNKGIEASIGYNAKFSDLTWSSTAVFTLNRNKIVRLSEGYKNPVTGEVFGRDSVRAGGIGDLENVLTKVGSMSDLYVSQVLREDNQGNLWVDPTTGAIQKTNIPRRYIGRTTPDYTIGWRNNFTYKNFDLSFLVDARIGGIGVSYTQSMMDAFGVSQQSATDRDNGGAMVYNGKRYADVQAYYTALGSASGGSVGMAAYYVYSATNVRLREAAFGYTFPGSFFGGKIDNIRVAVTGRNLFMFYNKSPFDPESTSSTGTYDQGIDYFRQPSYRSIGFSLKAQF